MQIHSWIFLTKSHCISKRNWATVVPEFTFFSAYTMQFVTGQTAWLGPHTLMTSDFNTCMCVCRGANCGSLSWKSMHHFGIYLEVQFSISFVNSFLASKCTKCYLDKQNTKRTKKLNKTKQKKVGIPDTSLLWDQCFRVLQLYIFILSGVNSFSAKFWIESTAFFGVL